MNKFYAWNKFHAMSKASEPPKCRVCDVAHWGTCMNHNARGTIADQAPVARRAGIQSAGDRGRAKVDVLPAATPTPNSRAKATRAKRPAAKKAAGDGVASRPRPGRAVAPAAKKAVKALRDKGDIIPAEAVKRGRGRPKTIADMKAYKAQKERERRAKKKSAEAK